MNLPFYWYICLPIYIHNHLSIYQSIYLSIILQAAVAGRAGRQERDRRLLPVQGHVQNSPGNRHRRGGTHEFSETPRIYHFINILLDFYFFWCGKCLKSLSGLTPFVLFWPVFRGSQTSCIVRGSWSKWKPSAIEPPFWGADEMVG